jgi:hypothetical protein
MKKETERLSALQKMFLKVPESHAMYYRKCFLAVHSSSLATFYNRMKRPTPVDFALWFHVSGVLPNEPMLAEFCEHYANTFRNVPTWNQQKEKVFQFNFNTQP